MIETDNCGDLAELAHLQSMEEMPDFNLPGEVRSKFWFHLSIDEQRVRGVLRSSLQKIARCPLSTTENGHRKGLGAAAEQCGGARL